MLKKNSPISRIFSVCTLVVFIGTNHFTGTAYAALSSSLLSEQNLSPDLSDGIIPGELGRVEETFKGSRKETVILVQDAHAIPEAQRSIQKIIDHFRAQYGLRFVAVEGASAELDPQIFRSFPDQEILRKVFEEYMERGELTGGAAAAVLGSDPNTPGVRPHQTRFHGVEEWPLYEEGLRLYLTASSEEKNLSKKIRAAKEELRKKKKAVYSKQLFEIDQALTAFRANHEDFTKTLRMLVWVRQPEKGSELALLVAEILRVSEDKTSLEREVEELALKVRPLLKKKDLAAAFNRKYQEFQTSQIAPEAFALFLQEIITKYGLEINVGTRHALPLLRKAIQNYKRLRDLEGTKLFREFEAYASTVKQALMRSEEERRLDQESRRLELLEKLANLTLTWEEWEEFGRQEAESGKQGAGKTDWRAFESHLAFYKNAKRREEAMFKNLMGHIQSSPQPSAFRVPHSTILVAGGFHTQGLTERFKQAGISYVLVMPRIDSLPEHNPYREQMNGNVSWQSYFRVENGKVDLYKAFVRATRDKLLETEKGRNGERERSSPILKQWRTRLLRDLAEKGQIEKAREYLSLLDERLEESGQDSDGFLARWRKNIERFVQNLSELQSRNQLTEQNVLKLLNANTATLLQLVTGSRTLQSNSPVSQDLVPVLGGKVEARHAVPLHFVQRRQNLPSAKSELRLAPVPVIGYLEPVRGKDEELSKRLVAGDEEALQEAVVFLTTAVATIPIQRQFRERRTESSKEIPQEIHRAFNLAFGRLLRLSQGNMEVFGSIFEEALKVEREVPKEEGQVDIGKELIQAVLELAQDPGAPYDVPPLSFYNPARYVYALLQQNAVNGFTREVLNDVVSAVRVDVIGMKANLGDVKAKAEVVKKLQKQFGKNRVGKGSYQYEILYDSLVEKDGEYYFTVQVLLGDEKFHEGITTFHQDSRKAGVLELLVTIPADDKAVQYQNPYALDIREARGINFEVGLLDAVHYINHRFPEWRPKAQRDIYASRVEALKKDGIKRQFLRPSVRQGHNPRFFEAFFREYIAGGVPLAYHIVHTRSERQYANVTALTAVSSVATAVALRGGTGVTATWYLESPEETEALIGRDLVYSFEMDHHRMDDTGDLGAFARNLSYFLGVYQEGISTGWPSANLQDETVFINQKVRNVLIALEEIAKTRKIDETALKKKFEKKDADFSLGRVYTVLQKVLGGSPEDATAIVEKIRKTGKMDLVLAAHLVQEIFDGTSVVLEGIPNAMDIHWIRNRYLKHLVNTVGKAAGGVGYDQFYIEPDFALDAQRQTLEEFMFLSLMEWLSAKAHGYPFGPGVPSYDNVHGPSAGDPKLALAGVLQYGAQTILAVADEPLARILETARKAPRGSAAKLRALLSQFEDGEEDERARVEELVGLVESVGERTEAEEDEMRQFVLAQFQKVKKEMPWAIKALKKAEREGTTLWQASRNAKRRLDERFKKLDIDRRAWITTHAASGLSAKQLRKAKEYGVMFANKSTEFQNVIFKILQLVAQMAADEAGAREELAKILGAETVSEKRLPWPAEIETAKNLYVEMVKAALAFAREVATQAAKRKDPNRLEEEIKREVEGKIQLPPNLKFPYFLRKGHGWSMIDAEGTDWEKLGFGWLPGNNGRFMWWMREHMTGKSIDDTLLFPNALSWDLPESVVRMAQEAIRQTIRFYHDPKVMNAIGGAAEYREFMKARSEARTVDMNAIVQELDHPDLSTRLKALGDFLLANDLPAGSVSQAKVGPILPSFTHVHSSYSYPGVKGVYSPTHLLLAAYLQGHKVVYLVDHESLGHITEGVQVAAILNEQGKRGSPIQVIYGVEFMTFVEDAFLTDQLRGALVRGIFRKDHAAQAAAFDVPVSPKGKVSQELAELVERFQKAKKNRARKQIEKLNKGLEIELNLENVVSLSPEGNVTERALAAEAQKALDKKNPKNTLTAADIRKTYITPVPYEAVDGFPAFRELVLKLSNLEMIPTLTMQLRVEDLEAVLPQLVEMGIKGLDLAGLESHLPNVEADIEKVVQLGKKYKKSVFFTTDYRGEGAVGWPEETAERVAELLKNLGLTTIEELARRAERSELRKQTEAALRSVAVALAPADQKARGVTPASARSIITGVRKDRAGLRDALLVQPDLLESAARREVLNPADPSARFSSPIRLGVLFARLPKTQTAAWGHFLKGFASSFHQGEIEGVFVDGSGPLQEALRRRLRERNIPLRSFEASHPSVAVREDPNASLPVAVLGAQEGETILDGGLWPLFIDQIEALKEDPDALEWLGRLAGRALVAYSELRKNPELRANPETLKARILQMLDLSENGRGLNFLQPNSKAGMRFNTPVASKVFQEFVRRTISTFA